MEGWISLHRKIRKNTIFNDMELLRLWLICLTEATHKEREQIVGRQTVHLQPGEFVTGRFDLQTMYNDGLKNEQQKSPATVWRWLEFLQTSNFVSIKSSNKFSVISIVNWDKYQKGEQDFDQQVSNKRATNEQQVSTNNNVNNDNNNKDPKISYAENVKLTEKEYFNLCKKYGKELTDRSIDYLSSYKVEKSYKTKSDNLTIQRWVIDAVSKSSKVIPLQSGTHKNTSSSIFQKAEFDPGTSALVEKLNGGKKHDNTGTE